MKTDICIFLFMLIATFVYACGPQSAPAPPAAANTPAAPEPRIVHAVPVVQAVPVVPGKKKRSIDLSKMKKCRGIQLDIITEQGNTSREASEIIENLGSKIKSMQKLNITMNSMKPDLIGRDRLKMPYKADAECNAVRHIMLDTLIRMETIQMIVTKCDCQTSLVVFKKEFKEE